MAGAAIIWTNGDKSEQIVYFNQEYVLITIGDMKKTVLGVTMGQVQERLKELDRYDICQQLQRQTLR